MNPLDKSLSKAKARKPRVRLTDMEIFEISLVKVPANEMPLLMVKSADHLGRVLLRAHTTRKGLDDGGLTTALAKARTLVSPTIRLKFLASALSKSEGPEQRLVYAAALVPEQVDAQHEVYSAEVIQRAAHHYAAKARHVGLQHRSIIDGKASVVESYVLPATTTINGHVLKAGTWVIALKIHDDQIWAACKRGEYGGVSVGGWCQSVPAEGAV